MVWWGPRLISAQSWTSLHIGRSICLPGLCWMYWLSFKSSCLLKSWGCRPLFPWLHFAQNSFPATFRNKKKFKKKRRGKKNKKVAGTSCLAKWQCTNKPDEENLFCLSAEKTSIYTPILLGGWSRFWPGHLLGADPLLGSTDNLGRNSKSLSHQSCRPVLASAPLQLRYEGG